MAGEAVDRASFRTIDRGQGRGTTLTYVARGGDGGDRDDRRTTMRIMAETTCPRCGSRFVAGANPDIPENVGLCSRCFYQEEIDRNVRRAADYLDNEERYKHAHWWEFWVRSPKEPKGPVRDEVETLRRERRKT